MLGSVEKHQGFLALEKCRRTLGIFKIYIIIIIIIMISQVKRDVEKTLRDDKKILGNTKEMLGDVE